MKSVVDLLDAHVVVVVNSVIIFAEYAAFFCGITTVVMCYASVYNLHNSNMMVHSERKSNDMNNFCEDCFNWHLNLHPNSLSTTTGVLSQF